METKQEDKKEKQNKTKQKRNYRKKKIICGKSNGIR